MALPSIGGGTPMAHKNAHGSLTGMGPCLREKRVRIALSPVDKQMPMVPFSAFCPCPLLWLGPSDATLSHVAADNNQTCKH